MKKVLIITYHFPPDAAVGAIRPAKFAKHLPDFGWEPVIYTVKAKHYEICDDSKLEKALENMKIYRANLIPGPLGLYSGLAHKENNSLRNLPSPKTLGVRGQNGINPIKRFFSSMVRLPDDKQGWIINIAKDGYRILKKHKIDTFITSGPPMSTHIGGFLLKNMTNAKWVTDFRDPWWPGVKWRGNKYRTLLSDAIERKLECKVVNKADLVISVAPRMTKYFESNLPKSQKGKCITITNGFDEDDFDILEPSFSKNDEKIRISYAGTLYLTRNPEPFFAALRKLLLQGKISKEKIIIEFMGDCSHYNGLPVLGLIEKYGLAPIVQLLGRMSYQDCIQRLMSSNGLLLFVQGIPEQISTKLFEYLRINKPIFSIADDGDAKDILESFENSFIANPRSVDDIAEKFSQMIEVLGNCRKSLGSEEKVKQYDRRYLTEKLARCLDGMDKRGSDV